MKYILITLICAITAIIFQGCNDSKVELLVLNHKSVEIEFGSEFLKGKIENLGLNIDHFNNLDESKYQIYVGQVNDSIINEVLSLKGWSKKSLEKRESYRLISDGKTSMVIGADESGVLYGCIEFSKLFVKTKGLPDSIDISDAPQMVLRGAAIGLQKTDILPGRKVYEYPITPENFPWFYNKKIWIRYLDLLVENKMNTLYLWNGHPFASLVKLDDYPYAVEVDSGTFKLNEEIYSFLTIEAEKRGIYVVQMFYNVLLSKPFAEHHGLETQERSRELTPLVSDYTKKSITEFVKKYPNVGLLVCLGEAMNTIEDDIEWFTQTIIPGVKKGLKQLGRENEPPIILRGHDTDPRRVIDASLPLYSNLYTMQKYNGESLTTYEPRGPWSQIHKSLSELGSVHVENVHIMANLEPFRYGSPDFIQKSVKAMHRVHGANGLHLYPQASYWDWPYTADKTDERMLQIDRDWIWYEAWARYAWNCNRNRQDEVVFWGDKLGAYYGCGEYGKDILEAYEQMGEIAPKLLRRFGITDGNRQTLSLGMFMSQLINPHKWRIYPSFYESNGPQGEILIDYAKKEWNGEAHLGETPPQIIAEVLLHSEMALKAIDNAASHVTNNIDDFKRLKNDVYCYHTMAYFYAEKVRAAIEILRFGYSNNVNDLETALTYLERSVKYYELLTELTKDSYSYANSMQTKMRRIPIDGTDGDYKHWQSLLPRYQEELVNFKNNLSQLKKNPSIKVNQSKNKLKSIDVQLITDEFNWYDLAKGSKIYSDVDYEIDAVSDELIGLKGVQLSYNYQLDEGTVLKFKNEKPIKVLVGYYNGHSYRLLNPPTLETDASANDRGQSEIRIANALTIDGLFPVNVYSYKYEAGEHVFKLGKGIALILGFIDGDVEIPMHDAGLVESDYGKNVDWLFY